MDSPVGVVRGVIRIGRDVADGRTPAIKGVVARPGRINKVRPAVAVYQRVGRDVFVAAHAEDLVGRLIELALDVQILAVQSHFS